MKFQVVDLDHNIIAEFKDEYSLDYWLLDQIGKNKLILGKFTTRVTAKGKTKEAIVEESCSKQAPSK